MDAHTHDDHLQGMLVHFKILFDKYTRYDEPKKTSSLTWLHKELTDMRSMIEKKLEWKLCPRCEQKYDSTLMVKCVDCDVILCRDCIQDHSYETRNGH